MTTYEIDWYRNGWEVIDQGLSLKEAYKLAKRHARVAKDFPGIGDIVVIHEEYGHIVLQFNNTTGDLVYVDLC